MSSYENYLCKILADITEISVETLLGQLPGRPGLVLIDVRETEEQDLGIIPGAKLVPRGLLEGRIEQHAKDLDQRIVLYCQSGKRSALAAHSLLSMGYRNVSSLAGGIVAWKTARGPIETPRRLSGAQRLRYSRHLLLPEVGEPGQQRLLSSRVLLLGAGGLGSPAALYLAAAGVGTLGLVDDDVVDESNLQRQVLHDTQRIGQKKVVSAEQTLTRLNPDVQVVGHAVRLTAENALEILSQYDLVIDGADNFPTRYLLNDASVLLRKPVVHASVYRFEAQLTTFVPFQGPCYRCLFPTPPPPELSPSCEQAGVLGVLPGVLGVLQATEAIKLLLGLGNSLVGRLVLYDALASTFQEMKLHKKADCPTCADPNRSLALTDTTAHCGR